MLLPRDMLDIVWDYAYLVRTKTCPLHDVARMAIIQQSVPSIFLKPTLPASPIFDLGWAFLKEQEFSYSNLYIPTPYARGNPYFPSSGLCTYVTPWAFTLYRLVQLMARKAIKNDLRTYPAILMRKANRHFNSKIDDWNHAFMSFWSRDAFLNEDCYKPENSADVELIQLACYQLERAKYF